MKQTRPKPGTGYPAEMSDCGFAHFVSRIANLAAGPLAQHGFQFFVGFFVRGFCTRGVEFANKQIIPLIMHRGGAVL